MGGGTALAYVIVRKEIKEEDMTTSMQIVSALILGCVGFLRISEDPVSGCSLLFVGGMLMLSGVDALWHLKGRA